MEKKIRAYARTHDMIILGFRLDAGRTLYGMVVKEGKRFDGESSYCFGRLYHVFGSDCVFDQCGCAFFEDEKTARLHAYNFFGIK